MTIPVLVTSIVCFLAMVLNYLQAGRLEGLNFIAFLLSVYGLTWSVVQIMT